MSAAGLAVWRLSRTTAREASALPQPARVLISARRAPCATEGTIEQLHCRDGRIHVVVRLADGSRGAATLDDDDVNSLELSPADTVFVRPAPSHTG